MAYSYDPFNGNPKPTRRALAEAIKEEIRYRDCLREKVADLAAEIRRMKDVLLEDYPTIDPTSLTAAQINANLESDLAREDEPDIVKRIRLKRAQQQTATITPIKEPEIPDDVYFIALPTDEDLAEVDALLDELLQKSGNQ
jgi:hypothetical protein